MKSKMRTRYEKEAITILALTAIFAAFFFNSHFKTEAEIQMAEREELTRKELLKEKMDNLNLLAKSISIYNISENKKIYDYNDNIPLPIASLAKTMTVLVFLKDNGKENVVTISPSAISQNGDYGLFSGEKWKLKDLAMFTMITSSNDGAYALGEQDARFLEKMNERAKKMNMKNATFLNFTGLDINGSPGAFASAEEINKLSIYAYKLYPDILGVTVLPEMTLISESGFKHEIKNTNTFTENLPGLLFSKTGYTALAGGNLSIIFKNKKGEEIAATVLGSTYEGRFFDMKRITDTLFDL